MSSEIAHLLFVSREINIFVGIPVFILGVVGGFLSTIVFVSLRTFRESPSAFYLTVMSLVNMGQLWTGLLSRITINVFTVDWTASSLVYCKFRMYFLVVCTNTSMLCLCLSTIDQYLATCFRPRWQRWSNLSLSRYLSIGSFVFSVLVSIPCLISYRHEKSPSTGRVSCSASDPYFVQLNIYVYRLLVSNILPLSVTLFFGLLTYRNVRDVAYRTVPLVRRELDKELTAMILAQDTFTFFTLLPITSLGILSLDTYFNQDPRRQAYFQLANNVAVMFYYAYFSVSTPKTSWPVHSHSAVRMF